MWEEFKKTKHPRPMIDSHAPAPVDPALPSHSYEAEHIWSDVRVREKLYVHVM